MQHNDSKDYLATSTRFSVTLSPLAYRYCRVSTSTEAQLTPQARPLSSVLAHSVAMLINYTNTVHIRA
ncbi:MAG: hypothetical protein L0G80_12285 [Shewanella sp.]|uniref:hypothetical protein n=1 Tax=Shewanella sp. TaxID=50422 RepID=UPI0026496249|nr:hypothetical protein [Shewanella sp.]MDN5500688.1 hypothetical protein [Shewanella sp.]MDN5527330.1 hypothetical protein [Shewanella sp.]